MGLWAMGAQRGLALGAAAVLLLPGLAVPQTGAPGQEPASQKQGQEQGPGQGTVIKSEVNLVNLFATVRDKNKRVITDLKQEDFKLAEDGRDEKISFFSKEVNLPITMGLLLDTSVSESDMLSSIQDAGGRFLRRVMKKGDETMIISFDTEPDLLSDFTDDKGQLERAINKARIGSADVGMIGNNPGPVGSRQITGTALYDAIYVACNEKLNGEAGRKALVIVTDADDQGSKVKLEEAVEAAQRTDTVIHILLVIDRRYGGNPGAAHKLAEDTGGRVIYVSSEKKLEEAFDQISEELRSQYTLGYYPTNKAKDGKFRRIKVETVNHDMKVLARRGYYAPRG
jgi:VWFA-related protein